MAISLHLGICSVHLPMLISSDIDIVLHEASPLGELVESCSFRIYLLVWTQVIPGCMDASAAFSIQKLRFDDGSAPTVAKH